MTVDNNFWSWRIVDFKQKEEKTILTYGTHMNYQINSKNGLFHEGIQNRNKKLYILTCGITTEIDTIKKQEI